METLSNRISIQMNVPGAKPVYEDLRKRFGSSRTRPEQPADAQSADTLAS